MQCDEKIIKDYFSGYTDVVNDEGYWYMYRFGKAQRDFYQNEGGYYGDQSRYTAGIKFSAKCCKSISFDINCKSCGGDTFSVGVVYADGKEENHIFAKETNKAELLFDKEDIVLYFPYNAELGIKNIIVDAGAPLVNPRKMLCFGDSITQGYMLTESAVAYPSQMGRHFDADIYNFGIGGYFIRKEVLNEIDALPQPWAVCFAYGTNDWHFENDYLADLPDMFALLNRKYSDIPIFVILPIARKSESHEVTKMGTLRQVRNNIEAEAEKYDNFYVLKSGIKIDTDTELYTDGIHPNDIGVKRLGSLLISEIEEVLYERGVRQ